MKNPDNTNGENYDSLIIPNCKIPADQAQHLHFTSLIGDSDTESAFKPAEKANGIANGPMLAITTVTEEKKDAHQVFDEMVESGKGYKQFKVFKGFVSRVWKMVVGEAKGKKEGSGVDENDGFDDLERGGV